MNNQTNIHTRVVDLERQCYKQKKIAWSLAIIALAGVALGFTQGKIDELTLRKLTIVDQEGRNRIVLSAGFDINPNAASIVYLDPDQKIRYWSGTEGSENVNTSYYDDEEKLAQSQCVVKDGGSAMSIFSKEGEVQAELSWQRDEKTPPRLVLGNGEIIGLARMLLYGKEMNVRIAIDAQHPSGDAVIYLMDNEFEQGISLISDEYGGSTISVNEGRGQAGWIVAATKEQGCMMNISDPSGTDRLSLMMQKDGLGGLIMFDGKSEPRAIISTNKDGIDAFRVGEFRPSISSTNE